MTTSQANSPTAGTSVSELIRRELQRFRNGDSPLRSREQAIAVGLATARRIERGNRAGSRVH